ncbi:Cof-type HAD-IIB family hydrolase [Mitsuokella sp.]|uniref:Cof-type HAD-IIB family hydrolase n=1 Tax=Mitsuokella TaxID=52225 RepID=UPI0029E35AF7|nr:Cof-type HAD-IIB family hydrolase [Mitsuokella sp.]MDD6382864.1 Cof-type HAD-IIB family hydrolase [Selenomonadaceae bacterium]MDY4475417.1 Cof-type HAD-IIB family hydrolase [Mitsuokella sp.]
MSIKLFVTDLDGTLLLKGQQVSQENIDAVQAAVKAGVTVTIATGRMYQAALPVAQALGVDVPIITYNGALIKSTSGEVFYENFLPEQVVADVVSFCQEKGWYIQSYSHDELCLPARTSEAEGYENAQNVKGRVLGWDGLKTHGEAVCKLLSITSGAEETEARIREMRAHFGPGLAVMRSNANYVEIVNPGVSKAAGIRHLAAKLGIPLDEIMAIGDANNDLPMLKAAGHSIAMGNAVPEVKAVCDAVTTTCEENGFAKAIYDYVLRG